jgi:hypothetical protein
LPAREGTIVPRNWHHSTDQDIKNKNDTIFAAPRIYVQRGANADRGQGKDADYQYEQVQLQMTPTVTGREELAGCACYFAYIRQ